LNKDEINELIERIDNLKQQVERLERWISDNKENVEQEISITNRKLKSVLINQLDLQSNVEEKYIEAHYLLKEFEDVCNAFYSNAIERMIHNHNKDYTIGEAKACVHGDGSYILAKRYYNRTFKVHSQLKYLTELVTTRKYVLNNLTNAIINSVEDHIL